MSDPVLKLADPPATPQPNGYHEVLGDDESLACFLRKMAEFDREFCACMASGEDFTLRLEVRGNKGVLLHARSYRDKIDRPDGAQDRIDGK